MALKHIIAVRDHSRLTGPARAVLYALASRTDGDGKAHPSVSLIAKDSGLSKRTVERSIRELEGFGEIKVKRGENTVSTKGGNQPVNTYQITVGTVTETVPSQRRYRHTVAKVPSHSRKGTVRVTQEVKREVKREEEINKSESGDIRRVFGSWISEHGSVNGKKPILDAKRRRKIEARLKEGFSVEQLVDAIRGCKVSRFHMGENETGTRYNKLETILRDAGTVEAHIARLTDSKGSQPSDPLDAEFQALHAELNLGSVTEDRRREITTRLNEIANLKQRGRQTQGTKAPLTVVAGGSQ